MKLALTIVALVALALPTAVGAASGKLAPRLVAALDDPASAALRAGGTLPVWVYFADRGPSVAETEAALASAAAALPERTLRRRAKMLPAASPLVDLRDLPPAARYQVAVAGTGARLREASRWLNAVSADATPEQIAALAKLPFVARLDLVLRFRRRQPQPSAAEKAGQRAAEEAALESPVSGGINYGGSLAGLGQINVPPVHELGYTGQGVVIGLLDSGFKTTHEALSSVTVLGRYDFVDDDEVVEDEPGDPSGQHGHGTRVLSAVVGYRDNELVAPAFSAGVLLAKTEDTAAEYPLEEDRWVAGLEWVEQQGADIVSSSLGYSDWYAFADLDGATAVTTIAADLAVARGLVVVNSAGNERGTGTGHIVAPADGDSVIAVGAVGLGGEVASFSSPGPTADGRVKPDVMAQGVGNHVVALVDDESYTTASGTSFACPLVAGVAALVLSRAPTLTPLQVREALRATADRAPSPDNDYGWGVVDALAAVTYWGATIEHDPLPDSEDTASPFAITATITDRLPLDPARMNLFWRTGPGPWLAEPLQAVAGDRWRATIPAQPAGTEVSYHLEVTDSADITTRLPHAGPDAPYTFRVGPDTTPPVIVHTPLGIQPLGIWPPAVIAAVSDNLGVGGVALSFSQNDGPVQGPFPLVASGATYALLFPLDATDLAVGDQIAYTLSAWDQAAAPNTVASGPHLFEVVATLGDILVLEDTGPPATELKQAADKSLLPPLEGGSNAATIAALLAGAGYTPTLMAAAAATLEDYAVHDAVVLSAGDGTTPVADAAVRGNLRAWALAGGRLLIEGGEIAYDALSVPGYPDFARDVLHAASWRGDGAGALQRRAGLESHPLLVRPYQLSPSIAVEYLGYGDQDVVDPTADAQVVMDTASYPGSAGILVHDDNAAVESGQIVYFAFDLDAIQPNIGEALVENAVAYLLAPEPPPSATVAGTVLMADRSDPTGVTVATPEAQTTVAGPDGRFELGPLHAGRHVLHFARDGFTTPRATVILAEGEHREGVSVELRPARTVHAMTAPHAPIPDGDALGLSSILEVAETGEVFALTVDVAIEHPWIGDLSVQLISPQGTQITLHDRSGGPADDIEGTWPTTLTVDGPGTLDDFFGEELAGDWTLWVRDASADAVGILHGWGLNAVVPVPPTAAGDLPAATRLLGVRPNPFNPRTEVVFDLARAGPVSLEIFDLRGRRVRRLVAAELPAGRHAASWDGRDTAGRACASGVYLCRLETGGAVQLRKATLVR